MSVNHGKAMVELSGDGMSAYLTIIPPDFGGEPIGFPDALEALSKAHVTKGIDEQSITEMIILGQFNQKVLVAKGTPPRPGKDAQVDWQVGVETAPSPEAVTDEEGRVDWRKASAINNVTEGQLLAIKIPPEPGADGMSVRGRAIPAAPGKDIAIPAGSNVRVSPDGNAAYSEIDGQVIWRDKKITVSPIYLVDGDVNMSTGSVNFVGVVKVKGNVQSGFFVKAGGDLEIMGNVENATLEVGGNCVIRGGYYGKMKDENTPADFVPEKVRIRGNLIARSIENAEIQVEGSLTVEQTIRNSSVSVGDKLTVTNQRGGIQGGITRVGNEIVTANLGTPAFAETVVQIGVNPNLRLQMEELEEEGRKMREQVRLLEREQLALKKLDEKGELQPDQRKRLVSLVRQVLTLRTEIRQKDDARAKLEDSSQLLKRGKITVKATCYPGVRIITQSNLVKVIKKDEYSVSFSEKDGEVQVNRA